MVCGISSSIDVGGNKASKCILNSFVVEISMVPNNIINMQ